MANEKEKQKKETEDQMTPLERQMLEAELGDYKDFLEKIEGAYANSLYKMTAFQSRLKEGREAALHAHDEANRELIEIVEGLSTAIHDTHESYMATCLRVQSLREQLGETGARISPCAEVKQMSGIDYDEDKAIEYLVNHGLNQFLRLDKKAFESAAPHLKLGFVWESKYPKVYISQNMLKALELGTAKLDAEIEKLLKGLETQRAKAKETT